MFKKLIRVLLAFIMLFQVLATPVLATPASDPEYLEDGLEYLNNELDSLEESLSDTIDKPIEQQLKAANNGTSRASGFPSLLMPSITPHRPNVYTNGFPVLSIDMNQPFNWDVPIDQLQAFRNNWQGAVLNLSNTSPEFEIFNAAVSARGRGNSTWGGFGGYKRPIRFRFPNNQWRSMFDSGYVGRDWVLLANVLDTSHLRTFGAFYLGDLMGNMNFVPNLWFIHLYLDGEYRGVYNLVDEREAIEGRGDLRLDIDPTLSEYMIEFDGRTRYGGTPVNTHWVDVRGSWDIRYPGTSAWVSTPNNPHALYVENFLNRVDLAILDGNRERIVSLIDVESFTDYYIVQELFKNIDSQFSSLFFQIRGQNEDRRLYAGPLWDFDLSSGSAGGLGNPWGSIGNYFDSPIGERTASVPLHQYDLDWFYHLLNTPWFRDEVKIRWEKIRNNEVQEMLNRIQYMALIFEDDIQRDFDRWPNHGNSSWNSPTVRVLETPLENAEFLHWWLTERVNWMTEWLNEPALERNVTVQNGTGDGNFAAGQTVAISAIVPTGQQFVRWESVTIPAVSFGNATSESTTFIMPAHDVTVRAVFEPLPLSTHIRHRGHVAEVGWQGLRSNSEIIGTTGQALQLEAVELQIESNISGGIEYRSHIQDIGWQDWRRNGELSGTTGRALSLEAIQIRLTGEVANNYDIYYRVHVAEIGWLDWAKNGEPAGSVGFAFQAEAVEIVLVARGEAILKDTTTPLLQASMHVNYSAHVEEIGWQDFQSNGLVAGTTGQAKRLEAIRFDLTGANLSGGIRYRTHVEEIGWQGWQQNGEIGGTTGQAKRLEAVQIELTGEIARYYHIEYRVHLEDIGWQSWRRNGQIAGTTGEARRLEAIEVRLVRR